MGGKKCVKVRNTNLSEFDCTLVINEIISFLTSHLLTEGQVIFMRVWYPPTAEDGCFWNSSSSIRLRTVQLSNVSHFSSKVSYKKKEEA